MDGFTNVGRTDEFRNGRPKSVYLENISFVVVKVAETIHAFENDCPHQHFSLLHQGVVDGCSITCPMHGWTFELSSGKSTNGNGKLKIFDVKVKDGWVWVCTENIDQRYTLFDGN